MDCKNFSAIPEYVRYAFPYVPFQQWTGNLYDNETALNAGTVFPELNQPVCDFEWGELYK